jgi:hypothetical protein
MSGQAVSHSGEPQSDNAQAPGPSLVAAEWYVAAVPRSYDRPVARSEVVRRDLARVARLYGVRQPKDFRDADCHKVTGDSRAREMRVHQCCAQRRRTWFCLHAESPMARCQLGLQGLAILTNSPWCVCVAPPARCCMQEAVRSQFLQATGPGALAGQASVAVHSCSRALARY